MQPISVYLDTNVWDFMFARGLDLGRELPRDEFCICVTREAEFEIPANSPAKGALKAFIDKTIADCQVRTDILFGFNNDTLPPEEQRVGGFDVGRWASPEELAFIDQQRSRLRPRIRPTRLYAGEADIALAARASHSVVLTLDAKAGPLNTAYQNGGHVVFLTEFDAYGMSLRNFILSRLYDAELSP